MTTQEIRQAYLDFFVERGHKVIPRAQLVPYNDPTTLFTGSGMQPLIPYLLGEPHVNGTRLVNSQTCLRAQDIDEVGDNRHTTFFEMLGNWSLGEYFKKEQLPWFWEFLTDVVGLDPDKLYVSTFIGDTANNIPKDTESAEIWKDLFGKLAPKPMATTKVCRTDGYFITTLIKTGGAGQARSMACRLVSRAVRTARFFMNSISSHTILNTARIVTPTVIAAASWRSAIVFSWHMLKLTLALINCRSKMSILAAGWNGLQPPN
jgi:hypothetical protein